MKTDFDIVHVHCFRRFETYPALLAAKLKKKKIVLTTHNPFTANTRSKILNAFIFLHDITFGNLFTRHLDTVICLLKEEIPIIKSFHVPEENITVIPNGINKEIFAKGDKQLFFKKYQVPYKNFKHIVIWIGRLNKVKGLENLETAVKQLPHILFLFIGPDDDASSELRYLYRDSKNVIFTGPIPHSEVQNAYAAGDIYVLPSHHEPFGVVLLEAMAQGLPIIATNAGGPREIVNKEFGITQSPSDQWAWFVNIRKLLEKPHVRRTMSQYAIKEAKKYLWDTLVEKVLKAYKI
jgi:glycosyltransferase involved in cell wall biosynthesis